jgi:hypothetical protein
MKGGIYNKSGSDRKRVFGCGDAGPAVHPSVSIDVHNIRWPRYGGHASLMATDGAALSAHTRGELPCHYQMCRRFPLFFLFFSRLGRLYGPFLLSPVTYFSPRIQQLSIQYVCVSTVTNYITTSASTKTIPIKEVSRFFYSNILSGHLYFSLVSKKTKKLFSFFVCAAIVRGPLHDSERKHRV